MSVSRPSQLNDRLHTALESRDAVIKQLQSDQTKATDDLKELQKQNSKLNGSANTSGQKLQEHQKMEQVRD